MKKSRTLRPALAAACVLGTLVACGGDDDTTVATTPTETPTARPAGAMSSLGADGWAGVATTGGTFTVTAGASGARAPGAAAVDPPLPLEALLLDGLQRAEAFAHADELAAAESDPGVS